MFTLSALVLTFSLFIYCEAGYVDTLPKCSIKDSECLKGVYEHMMKTVGSTGLEELGIPPLDPMVIDNISVNILNDLSLTISEGTMKGMSNCVFNSISIDWEKGRGNLDVTCSALSVKGQFDISGTNPDIQSIIGSNTLNGQGKAKVKLENTHFHIEFTIYLSKKDDGEVHVTISNKDIKYTYDIGKAQFITEKIIIANNDLSQIVSSYLNDNWRSVMKQYGSSFVDKALELFIGVVASVCNKIPANKYITDDITPYLKN